ncbi:barrier-to-autointegration factor-like [Scleropages formosus]|uniref:Barrier-to-autointegration factor-like protein n=1 Tax=Scleropages formosus TaxID=113540 RepID=A0A0P7YI95_SCLFO|nr:barrier-to-autointegration factor-like [Scleropages formosus]
MMNRLVVPAVFVPKITAPLGNMTSTSKKHRDFVAEPLGHKSVFVLPGIGKVLGERLVEKGFDKACMVLGQFLLLRKNQGLFCEWLKSTCGANRKQQEDCYAALLEWCYSFL